MAAAQSVFQNSRASGWAVAAMVLPPVFLPLLRLGQHLFPSKAQQEMERAGSMLWNTSLALIEVGPVHCSRGCVPCCTSLALVKMPPSACSAAVQICNAAAAPATVDPQLSSHRSRCFSG